VGSSGDAAVIDPSVPSTVYIAIARENGWSIRSVIETHIHADHLSRARDLASHTGATLLLPVQERVRFTFTKIADGQQLPIGHATITALHTPGHTGESVCYVLDGAAVFTGDTLFTNGVGRPDLHADPEAARHRATALFRSLSKLRQLPGDLVVLPAHTSEPVAFDRTPIAATLRDIDVWLTAWLPSESTFIERVTSRLPPTPPNFARIVELNEEGEMPSGDPTELEAGSNRCAVR
jgi:glyoxylase-like metal-dependent hydrolase (beta-lactamase superfamily II)